MSDAKFHEYSNPDILVTTDWVLENVKSGSFRLVESNEDPLLYRSGHIEGAVEIDWVKDLNDPIRRDYLDKKEFEELLSHHGITNDTEIIFYGDKNNWWACYAFWVFSLFGHKKMKIMDGGRNKWFKEQKPWVKDVPSFSKSTYKANERDDKTNRAFRDQAVAHSNSKLPMIDVRSPEEYRGERLHMPDYPNEGALRGGHIPGAANIPWARSVDPNTSAFKSFDELNELYVKGLNLKKDDNVITYCRIGERSSHTWFVLKYLMGFQNVRNYDGSWTEYGNLVGVPIEK